MLIKVENPKQFINLKIVGASSQEHSNDQFFIKDIITKVFSCEVERGNICLISQSDLNKHNQKQSSAIKNIYKIDKDELIITLSDNNDLSQIQIANWIKDKEEQKINYSIINFSINNHFDLIKDQKSFINLDYDSQKSDLNNQISAQGILQNIEVEIQRIVDLLKLNTVEELYFSLDLTTLSSDYIASNPSTKKRALEPHHIAYILSSLSQVTRITGADINSIHLMPHFTNKYLLNPHPETTKMNTYLIVKAFKESIS